MNEWSLVLPEQVAGALAQYAISVQCGAEVWTYLNFGDEEYFYQNHKPTRQLLYIKFRFQQTLP